MADKTSTSVKSDTKKDWAGSSGRTKGYSTSGAIVFTLLRLLDPALQYTLLSGHGTHLLNRIGLSPTTAPTLTSTSGVFGLSPYHALILGLSLGSAAKHIYWVLVTLDYDFPPTIACVVASYNLVLNTLNTMLSLWTWSSNAPVSSAGLAITGASALLDPRVSGTVPLGLLLYSVGLTTEWVSEIQRKAFKAKPENKDRPYSDGLFGLATNINYGGYTLWRIGYATVCAGLPWGVVMAAWNGGDFVARAIPGMEEYCQKRVSLSMFMWVRCMLMDHSMASNGQRFGRRCHTSCCHISTDCETSKGMVRRREAEKKMKARYLIQYTNFTLSRLT